MVNRPFPKLAYKFFGPFEVLERVGTADYRLALPADSAFHLVFHVSQLKPFVPCYTPVFAELPKMSDLSVQDLDPELILDRRLVKKGNCVIVQVLVKWVNVPATSATGEDFEVIKQRFPDHVAWGQEPFGAGGDVRHAFGV